MHGTIWMGGYGFRGQSGWDGLGFPNPPITFDVTMVAPVLDFTELGNVAEAPRCTPIGGLEKVLHGGGGGGLHAAPPAAVPRPADLAPRTPGASWPPTPSARPWTQASVAPLTSLPPRAAPSLPHGPVAVATTFTERREEEQQEEGMKQAGRQAQSGSAWVGSWLIWNGVGWS